MTGSSRVSSPPVCATRWLAPGASSSSHSSCDARMRRQARREPGCRWTGRQASRRDVRWWGGTHSLTSGAAGGIVRGPPAVRPMTTSDDECSPPRLLRHTRHNARGLSVADAWGARFSSSGGFACAAKGGSCAGPTRRLGALRLRVAAIFEQACSSVCVLLFCCMCHQGCSLTLSCAVRRRWVRQHSFHRRRFGQSTL